MSQLEQLISDLEIRNSNELMLFPFSEIRYRSTKGWEILDSKKISGTEVREYLWTFLPEQQKTNLANGKNVSGSVGLNTGMNISYHAYKHKLGYSAVIKVIKSEIRADEKNTFPENILNQALKGKGLILVAGPAKSGRSTLVSHLVTKRNSEMNSYISIVENAVHFIHQPDRSVIAQFEVGQGIQDQISWENMNEADVVVLDMVDGYKHLLHAIEMVESGKLVVLTLNVDSFSSLIKRIESEYSTDKKIALMDRLANSLLSFINLRLIPGLQEEAVFAMEIILFNSMIKELLKKSELKGIEKAVLDSGEKSGMRSLNQSIANLCVRRKIDLKNGFLSSYDPEALDLLFSKLGV